MLLGERLGSHFCSNEATFTASVDQNYFLEESIEILASVKAAPTADILRLRFPFLEALPRLQSSTRSYNCSSSQAVHIY